MGRGGEEGQSLTLYQVIMRAFYVYICTYLALETTPYLYVNGFCTGCDPAKKAVADRFSPANHPLTAKVCPNVHVCVHVCVLCVYMCVYCVCTCVRTVCVHVYLSKCHLSYCIPWSLCKGNNCSLMTVVLMPVRRDIVC